MGELDSIRSQMPDNIASGVVKDVPSGNDGHKRQLLQKLISNLLSKPGRSMHEMINGVKDAIGAYKNYAKEWDSLSGMGMGAMMGGAAAGGGMRAATGGADIQKILRSIQEKKGGAVPQADQPAPQMPMMPQGMPAPMMGEELDAQGGPGFGMGISLPAQAPGLSRAQTNMNPPASAALIAGQPQTSDFSRPAPVNHLGMFGY